MTKDARERVSDDLRATMTGIDRMAHLVDPSIADTSREAIRVVLGLLADGAESDRKLGAAVRASGVTITWLRQRVLSMYNSRGSLALSSPAYANAHAKEITLYESMIDAMRAEEER